MIAPIKKLWLNAVRIMLCQVVLAAGTLICYAEEAFLTGKTMGTTYNIKIVTNQQDKLTRIQEKIDQRLQEINRSMSIFLKDSEISRFNAVTDTVTVIPISADFKRVMEISAFLYSETQGAWDGTIKPLLALWGFQHERDKVVIPEHAQIQAVIKQVGFDGIKLTENGLIKRNPSVTLDLASVAKGDAVDQIAELLKQNGLQNFLVEIGGEVYAAGLKADGSKWRIGINTPDKNSPLNQVYAVIALSNQALATSGDYRNYFMWQGKTYSHIIDPQTGYPVSNNVVSASVLADNCAIADGLATALFVMGSAKGIKLTEQLPAVECLIIVRSNSGKLINYKSSGFPDI